MHDPLTAVIAISSKVFDVSPNCLKKLATSLGIVPRNIIIILVLLKYWRIKL